LQAIAIIQKLMTCLSENREELQSAVSWQHCGLRSVGSTAVWLQPHHRRAVG